MNLHGSRLQSRYTPVQVIICHRASGPLLRWPFGLCHRASAASRAICLRRFAVNLAARFKPPNRPMTLESIDLSIHTLAKKCKIVLDTAYN
jgi:hypothetical protein